MSEFKKLPVNVEVAIAAAIKATREIGGDELTLKALTQELIISLYGADYDFRDGFKFKALGYIDLSGRNHIAALIDRTASVGERRERELEA